MSSAHVTHKGFFPKPFTFLSFLKSKKLFSYFRKIVFYFTSFKIQKAKKELGRQAEQVWKKEGLKA